MAYFHLMRCVIDECNRCVRVLMFWVLLCGFWGITQEGSLAWPDPTRRKGLVQCLTWIVIMQSAHRLNYKYLPTAIVFDHSFHTSGVQGAKLFKAVPIMTTASYRTPNYLQLWGVRYMQIHVRHWTMQILPLGRVWSRETTRKEGMLTSKIYMKSWSWWEKGCMLVHLLGQTVKPCLIPVSKTTRESSLSDCLFASGM